MRHQVFWLLVLAVFSIALWRAKFTFDHPPLSRADRELRQTLAQADDVVVIGALANNGKRPVLAHLQGAQIGELAETLRLTDAPSINISNFGDYLIRIRRQKKLLGEFDMFLASRATALVQPGGAAPLPFGYQAHGIHPRFVARLRAYLKRMAPYPSGHQAPLMP